jgi:hypothetical protein
MLIFNIKDTVHAPYDIKFLREFSHPQQQPICLAVGYLKDPGISEALRLLVSFTVASMVPIIDKIETK